MKKMREIIFRIWDDEKCEFSYWGFKDQAEPIFTGPRKLYGHHQQYTGLKDKNGTRIFEGDVVELSSEEYYSDEVLSMEGPWEFVGVVKFENSLWTVCDRCDPSDNIPLCHLEYGDIEIEVIGNIHEEDK
jgi:hypothetical protein